MKKFLMMAAALLLASCTAAPVLAGPNSLIITQRNAADTGNILRTLDNPTAGDGLLVFRLSTQLPAYITLGSGFTLSQGVLSVAAGTGAQGPAGPAGSPGAAGLDGKSAYQLAVDTGYSGSVIAWLASLKGADGAPGASITGPVGPQGPQGPAGASVTGPQGPPGASVTGPTGAAGLNGKSAYELAQVSGYTGTLQAWLASLQGAAGRDGANGAVGATGATGAQGQPGTPAPTFNYGMPAARTLAASTAYQASDPTKPAILYPSFACQNATTVVAASGCTLQVRIGNAGLTCSTGTLYYTQSLTVALGLLLTQNSTNPVPIFLPTGARFIVCPTAGAFTITTAEQTAG